MAYFTPVASWPKGGQDVSSANEIIQAYIEHRQVLGQSVDGISFIEAGDNAQDKAIWNEIGSWLQTNCVNFLDTTNIADESFLTTDKSFLNGFSVDTWKAAAGLHGCYRRKINAEDEWSYGPIAAGDIRGAWTFQDLQKGLSALKWTHKREYGITAFKGIDWYRFLFREMTGDPKDPPLNELRAQFTQGFNDWPWHNTGYGFRYQVETFDGWDAGWWRFAARRAKTTITLTRILDCDVAFYMKAREGADHMDHDATGIEQGKYGKYDGDVEVIAGTPTEVVVGDISTIQMGATGYFNIIDGVDACYAVNKWRYTYN